MSYGKPCPQHHRRSCMECRGRPAVEAVHGATWAQVLDCTITVGAHKSTIEADRPGSAPAPRRADGVIDVSVILGTVQRPAMLRDCIEAVRASLSGLTYEIVVAYGTPDEPALPWLRAQSDVVSILGGMDGAIPAFNRAYSASLGRLVCQINDDVLVDDDSIAVAVAHVDADPTCAGVVFRFDRGDGRGYRHERLGGSLHPNQIVARRETCEVVVEHLGAFWGDSAHRTDRTYGGDSAFGAICHHHGLRLDSVEGVTCRDLLADDSLRATNTAAISPGHGSEWRAMYGAHLHAAASPPAADEWPHMYVPRPGMAPRRSPVEAGAPLRLLHLSLAYDAEPQVDLRHQFARIGPTAEIAWWHREEDAFALALAHRPDMVWAQIQSDPWTAAHSAALRAAVGPDCTLILWTGDVRTSAAQPVERWLAARAHEFDLVLADSLTYARKLATDEQATAACGYVGCGIDPGLNPWDPSAIEDGGAVFLGTNYTNLDGGDRQRLLGEVATALPGALTVYGPGWPASLPAREFVVQPRAAEIMRRAAVTISSSLFQCLDRYTSDRLKRALHCGAVVAVRRFAGMDGLGLVEGVNCIGWSTAPELVVLLRDWLRPERADDRMAIRERAAALAADRFENRRMVEETLAIVRDFRARK